MIEPVTMREVFRLWWEANIYPSAGIGRRTVMAMRAAMHAVIVAL
jgi:hypothetical protein